MAKFTDAVEATLVGYFNAGDQPTEAQFTELMAAIQAGIDEHTHTGLVAGDGWQTLGSTAGPLVLTMLNTGCRILDTGGDHDLILKPGSNLGANRELTLTTGDAARTITLSGNPTLDNWFDQSVKQAASPTFADVFVPDGGTFGIAGNELLTVNAAGNFVFSGALVGVGMAPTYAVDVNGDVRVGDADNLYCGDDLDLRLYHNIHNYITSLADINLYNFMSAGAGNWYVYANGAFAVIVDANGDMGVGVANPVYRLDVGDDLVGVAGKFFNDGNNANRGGISIQCGSDADAGLQNFVDCRDGDGTFQGYLENDAAGNMILLNASDKKLKKDIEDFVFQPDLKERFKAAKYRKYTKRGSPNCHGYVAQELQECFPDAVAEMTYYDPVKGGKKGEVVGTTLLGVSQMSLIAPLMEMVKQLIVDVEALQEGARG